MGLQVLVFIIMHLCTQHITCVLDPVCEQFDRIRGPTGNHIREGPLYMWSHR